MALAALLISLLAVVAAVAAALSSGRSATAAERSERRTAEANANALGPSVKVSLPPSDQRGRYIVRIDDHLEIPIANSTDGATRTYPNFRNIARVELEVAEKLVVPLHDDVRLLCCVSLQLQNEGSRTTTVHIDAPLVGLKVLPGEVPADNGEVVLDPSIELPVFVYAGLTVSEWFKQGCPVGPMTFTYSVEASVEPDGAVQRWTLEITAPMLDTMFGEASAARVVAHTPPTANITQRSRRYPPTPAVEAPSRFERLLREFSRTPKAS